MNEPRKFTRVHGQTVRLACLQLLIWATSGLAGAQKPAPQPERAELERALAADAESSPADKGSGAAAGEADWVERTARVFQSFNPDMSFIFDGALAYFSADEPLMSGAHDPNENGFNLQQFELAVSASVDPYFRFDSNLVFGDHGFELEEAYGTTLALPWNLQVRAGQFLTRFGRINATHPHTRDFVDQPVVMGKFFGGEGSRGLGLELSALLPLPWYVELVGSVTDARGDETARSFFGGADLGVESVFDFVFNGAIKQFFPLAEDWSVAWGLSAANGPNTSDERTSIWGTDVYVKYRPVTRGSYTIVSLQLEWLLRRRHTAEEVLQDHGLYAYLLWRFSRRWAAAARYELVSGVEDDPLDPQWSETRQRVGGNLTFWLSEFSRLRLQYNYDRPQWRDDDHAVILAVEFVLGAHGAHKF